MTEGSQLAVLVVAAGRGVRVGEGLPKQYRLIAGKPLLAHTISALQKAAPDALILPIIHKDDLALFQSSLGALERSAASRLASPQYGGATRQESVRLGLQALARLATAPEIVLIHDAARPFATKPLIERAIAAAKSHGAAIPGVAPADTVKEIDGAAFVTKTVPRANLQLVQTPQAFAFPLILDAHEKAALAGVGNLSDDAAVAEWAGHRVHIFAGDEANVKITTTQDLASAEARLLGALADIRTGQGYDVHAFGPGDHVWLGGVQIPHDRGLVGHSDADVVLHAITDALLGAVAEGDIGSHFPPSDPKWRGAPSRIFLSAAAEKVRAKGGVIAHIDATIICERPKLGPHRNRMRESIAAIASLAEDRVAIKATTSERLGFTGREEGIAALAIATIRLPF